MDSVLRDRKAIALFLGPALLLYALVMLVPIGWALGLSLFEGSPIEGFRFVGLSGYHQAFHDRAFWQSAIFGLKYALVVSAGQVILGLLLALLYTFYLRGGSVWIRTLVFFPVVLPTVAVAEMFAKLFAIAPQYGLVNAVLSFVGLDHLVQAWLGQANTAFWVLCLMDIWRAMGFYAILLYAGIVEVPHDYIEAARLDGASGWRLIWSIVIPLLRPILVSCVIFALNGTLKVFDTVLALTNGGPGTATSPLTLLFYKVSFTYGEYGYGSTIAVLLTLECLVVTLLVLKVARREVAQA